jgi:translation initiation factor 4E
MLYYVLYNIRRAASSQVCGLVVSLRKSQDRIALWTRTAASMEVQHQIGTRLRQALSLPDKCTLKYQTHDDALSTGSSFQNKA